MWRDEAGVALIYALFAVLILAGMSTVFAARAISESRATASNRDREAAVHVAEAGAEELIDRINVEETRTVKVITEGPPHDDPAGTIDDHTLPVPSGMTEDEWVTALAESHYQRDSGSAVTTEVGQAYAVRPLDGSGQATPVVYAVGFVPGVDTDPSTAGIQTRDRQVRVLRMQIARRYFQPDKALQTDGNLEFGGNAEIISPGCDPSLPTEEDCNADVHANGDVTVSGGSQEIQGALTASGTISGSPNTAVGSPTGGEEIQETPEVHARDFYDRQNVTFNTDPETGQTPKWWDLCPDGTIRPKSTAGPCQSSTVEAQPIGNQHTEFLGWRFKNGQWQAKAVESGVFYVYQTRASISGSAGSDHRAVSVFVEYAVPAASSLDRSGSLELSGNPKLTAAYPDVLFVLDRDLDMQGNVNQSSCDGADSAAIRSGLIAVGEQLKTQGTVDVQGAVLVQDLYDWDDLVQRTNDGIGGTMCLQFDENLDIDLPGKVTIEFWNEL